MYRILEKIIREESSLVTDGAGWADTSSPPFSDFYLLCSRGVSD